MIREIRPSGPLSARVAVPGSKSMTNRSLLCAALAEGESRIGRASDSEDSDLLANGLNQLGVLARRSGDMFVVEGRGGRLYAPRFPIPVGNAGTTTRFLAAAASLAEGTVTLRLDPRMAERPVGELLQALRALGVTVSLQEHAGLLTIAGGGLAGGDVAVGAERSSQFLSALLLVAPLARSTLRIITRGTPVSAPYVAMTLAVMGQFGVRVESDGRSYTPPPGCRYRPAVIDVERDASSASYFLAAALIAGGEVEVEGMPPGGLQADAEFSNILREMGAEVYRTETGLRVRSGASLRGIDVGMQRMPDVVPTLAVTALFAEGPTRIRDVGHLRYKESDRLEGLATGLSATGADVSVAGNDLVIVPRELHGATLNALGDHRLAMSFALVGLRVPGVAVTDPDCVRKSFPRFWDEFARIGGV